MTINGYRDSRKATRDYLAAERDRSRAASQIVLVSAESMKAVHRAYPNYYADTSQFLRILEDFIQGRAEEQ